MAILKVQVNQGAKDHGAKDFLKKDNTGSGSHKTTHKVVTSIRFSQDKLNFPAIVAAVENAHNTIGREITIEPLEPVESYGDGSGTNDGPSVVPGQETGAWEYDSEQRMQKYWDGLRWVFWDEAEKKEKFWDGERWRWVA
ncbi:hypothetical protein DL98DRAFT_599148 [Cadophora sp. DSE1049]|nr:hypothetical protein DL98DRAFT_599148 [Cadophora sp. DSE1049]